MQKDTYSCFSYFSLKQETGDFEAGGEVYGVSVF